MRRSEELSVTETGKKHRGQQEDKADNSGIQAVEIVQAEGAIQSPCRKRGDNDAAVMRANRSIDLTVIS
jgi:hypothetical protein